MKVEALSYHELGASALFKDFVEEQSELRLFFNSASPFEASSFLNVKNGSFGKVSRQNLTAFLQDFNQQFAPPTETIEAIRSLADEQVFTIVTGQQICYFGGPAYSFYKTLTLIALSRYLKAELGLSVVPVFWMADEDHDYEEINHVWLPDFRENGVLKKTELRQNAKAGHSAGKLFLDESVAQAWGEIEDAAARGSAYAAELLKLHENWQAGQSWLHAFGKLMLRVFGKFGLVLAGSNHPVVKKLCRPVLEQVLCDQLALTKILSDTSQQLAEKWHAQVTVTDSLLFWQHPEKGRVKMPSDASGWHIPGEDAPRQFTKQTAEELDDAFFDKLSPNAFLRPVMQQYLLPNLAYAGGAAEIAYHAQMKPFFEKFALDMPLLLPRFGATVVEPGIHKAMGRLPFSFTHYKAREEHLLKEIASQQLHEQHGADLSEVLENWKNESQRLFEQYFRDYAAPGSSLDTSLNSSLRRVEKVGEQFAAKVLRAQRRREKESHLCIQKVQNAIFPQGIPQERMLGWVFLIAMYGEHFTDDLITYLSSETLKKIRFHHIIYL